MATQPVTANQPGAAVPEAPVSAFEQRARLLIDRGIPVAPVPEGQKAICLDGWQNLATTDRRRIEAWVASYPNGNTAAVAKAEKGGVCFIEFDCREAIEHFQKETGLKLSQIKTFKVRSRKKGNHGYLCFHHTSESIAVGNVSAKKRSAGIEEQGEFFSFRAHNRYMIGPMSVVNDGQHPDPYTIVDDSPICDVRPQIVEWVRKWKDGVYKVASVAAVVAPGSISEKPESADKICDLVNSGVMFGVGERNDICSRYAYLRWVTEGCDADELDEDVREFNEKRNSPPLSRAEIDTLINAKLRLPQIPPVRIGGKPIKRRTPPVPQPTVTPEEKQRAADEKREAEKQALVDELPKEKSVNAKIEDMPEDLLIGRLGEVCQTRMKDFPLAFSWLSLVVHAGVWVPVNSLSSLRTNLYFAPVGAPHSGKSMASAYAQSLLGLTSNTPPLIDVMPGSAEGLVKLIAEANGQAWLVHPDELGFLLERASLEGASFPYILDRAYYHTAFALTTGGGKHIPFNCRLSVVGGIAIKNGGYEAFGDLFGAKTVTGLYDRFLFGLEPTDFEYCYHPFEGSPLPIELSGLRPVTISNEMWEAKAEWVKRYKLNPRTTESAIRVAAICACYDGRDVLRPQDIEKPVIALARYETDLQTILQPNSGKNDDGRLYHKFMAYLRRHGPTGELLDQRKMLRDTNAYDFGARCEIVLASMEKTGEIERFSFVPEKGGRSRIKIKLAVD